MKKPWITGGDNYANSILPVITILAIVLSFLAGRVFEFFTPKKEILIKNQTTYDLSNIETSCKTIQGGSAKAHSETTIVSKICEEELNFRSNDSYLGECKIPPFDYQRIEISVTSIPFKVESCLFIK